MTIRAQMLMVNKEAHQKTEQGQPPRRYSVQQGSHRKIEQ